MSIEVERVPLRSLTTKIGSGVTPKGGSEVYTETGPILIRSQNVNSERLILDDIARLPCAVHERMKSSSVIANDVLLNITGASIGRSCVMPEGIGEANVNQHVCIIRCKDTLNPSYLQLWLASAEGQRIIEKLSAGGSREGLNFQQIGGIRVPASERAHQDAIVKVANAFASHLLSIDRAIDAKRYFRRGLMQQLLTGKRRFLEFQSIPWTKSTIGTLFEQVERPVIWDESATYTLVSVRRRSGGLFLRAKKRGSQIKVKSLYVLREGDILISTRQVVHGAISLVPAEFDGAHVSGEYLTLVARKSEVVSTRYFDFLSRLPRMYHASFLASYGVDIEKLTFNPRWYLATTIDLPPSLEEQHRIISALEACDRELLLLTAQREMVAILRRAVLSRLLSGELAVPASP